MKADWAILLLLCVGLSGCAGAKAGKPGRAAERMGDEIMVCGRLFHTGAPVVLWTDPGGYDAYRVDRRFVTMDKAAWEASTGTAGPLKTPNRYGLRYGGVPGAGGLSADDVE